MGMIEFNQPILTGREREYMEAALQNGHISACGPFTARCEDWLRERLGAPRAILTTSGTDALEMAALVPVIPAEVGDWCGFDATGEMDTTRGGLRTWRRTVRAHQDWATGRLMERNEQLLALAA